MPSWSRRHIFVRRSTEISTSGGSSETDMNAFAVMPCTCSPFSAVITVTPVANIRASAAVRRRDLSVIAHIGSLRLRVLVERIAPIRPARSSSAESRTRCGSLTSAGALLRVVERERHDRRRNALLETVQLPDLDGRAQLPVPNRHAAERDVLAQRRRRAAGGGATRRRPCRPRRRGRPSPCLELEPDELTLGVASAGPAPPCRRSRPWCRLHREADPASNGST